MIHFTDMAKLYFTGIKHSGKTTQARLVSSLLSLPFSDSDDLVLKKIDEESIREFYRKHGKQAFMAKEKEAVIEFTGGNPSFILSLGGGVSDNTPLLQFMKKEGKIIYLRREESEMLPVILKHGIPAFLDPDNLESSFHDIYTERDRIYTEVADLIVDLGPYRDKEETARELVGKLRENGYV